jgi:hypothetical protein
MNLLTSAQFRCARGTVLALLVAAICAASGKLLFAQITDSTPSSQVVARAGDNFITEQDFEDLRVLDSSVLDTPLNVAEQQEARQNILHQFQNDPAAFTKNRKETHDLAELYRHGSLGVQTALALKLWAAWSGRAQTDPHTKWWVGLVMQHNPAIVQSGDLVVTHLQLIGLFADDDWVAQTAGLPLSTQASRAAYIRDLKTKFATMPQSQKEMLAHADQRWVQLQDPIMDHSDLRQIAVNQVHERVHGQQDVFGEARNLEDIGVRFNAEMAQFTKNMAAISGMDYKTKSTIHSLNFADRKFWGEGP